jgi:hypothetical protein
MSEPTDLPPRGAKFEEAATLPLPPRKRHRHWGLIAVLAVVVLPLTGFALYTWARLSFVYSRGERAGFVQKISKKGWVCQTWEGELAMANLPGTMPQIFTFTIRSDSIAQLVSTSIGKRVALAYEQHPGIPLSCFGDTEYFIVGVRPD